MLHYIKAKIATSHFVDLSASFLKAKPFVGVVCAVVPAATNWMPLLSPVVSFIAICFGAGIGGLTFAIKFIELRNKLKK